MRDAVAPNRRILWPLLCLLCLIAAVAFAEPVGSEPLGRQHSADLQATWTFSGRVYNGAPYDQSDPIGGVTIKLYGSNNAGQYEQLLDQTQTSSSGWYALTTDENDHGIWELYYIVESQPSGYTSVDATSVGGSKCGMDCIVYAYPLGGKTFTGNKFWERSNVTPTATRTRQPSYTSTPTRTRQPGPTPTPTRTPRVSATPTLTPRVTHTPEPPPERGPVTFPGGDWPWYAQGEISVHPEPPIAGALTRLCVEVINSDPTAPHHAEVAFRVANFGIGVPFHTVGHVPLVVPAGGNAVECVLWTPPTPGHWCVEVVIHQDGFEPQISQRNIDLDEPLEPGVPHSRSFPVGNPTGESGTVELRLIQHLPGWEIQLEPGTLPDMQPEEIRDVTLTVRPPAGEPLPPDGHVVVDVEAYIGDHCIGGFRKVFRPPVPLHRLPDPPYAESEISIHPYPVRVGEPTELCVELRNPTDRPQDVHVQFEWAAFGIGLPFTPINGPRPVHLAPHSIVKECLHWVPPINGHLCLQVALFCEGYEPQFSQRNMDVDEPLQPGVPHTLVFPVSNPFERPVTVTLGLVPHLPDWGLTLDPDVLPNLPPGETRSVSLTVQPPVGVPLPPDGQPIVDVEAFVEGELIGGIRKIYRPKVPLHQPRDPVYAESEIGIDPYPVQAGRATKLSVELRNPTDQDVILPVAFSVADFGIGLPFSTADILPNPVDVFVPAHGAARAHVLWDAPRHSGHYCVQVEIAIDGQEPMVSQRNVDVGEPLRPGASHALQFAVGNTQFAETVAVQLGLIKHMLDWDIAVHPDLIPELNPGEQITVTLEVTPPLDVQLGTGEPIVDVEAWANGELLGGIRKLDIPPVPVHKPHEKGYAESEITVGNLPFEVGKASPISAELYNASNQPVDVDVSIGWANFGLGIPFQSTGMDPITATVHLPPMSKAFANTLFTPTQAGHQCILIRLQDQMQIYQPQESQRNIDVSPRPDCGVTKVFSFTVYNDSPFTATVDIGMITFNVPSDWEVTTNPTGTLEIGPFSEAVVAVHVLIPCAPSPSLAAEMEAIRHLQGVSNSYPTIDVEGYIDNELAGGIRIVFDDGYPMGFHLTIPLIFRSD